MFAFSSTQNYSHEDARLRPQQCLTTEACFLYGEEDIENTRHTFYCSNNKMFCKTTAAAKREGRGAAILRQVGGRGMPGRRQRNETFLAARFLWFGHYKALEHMVLIIQFSFVFLFSLGVLYNPEKLRGVRDVFLFLTFRPLPLAGHRWGSFLPLK